MQNHSTRNSASGFTLIEPLTSMAIISILAGEKSEAAGKLSPANSKRVQRARARYRRRVHHFPLTKTRGEEVSVEGGWVPIGKNNWEFG